MSEFAIMTAGTLVAQRFRVLKIFGKGGMGAVYEVEDTHTSTIVALKTLRTDLYDREDLVKRFEREARAAARIGHPNIIQVYAVGHDDALRTRFIVQEALRGTDVAGCLNELGSLSPLSALAVALPVMDALIAAHEAGIVHRDIKPENIFLHEMDNGTVVPKVIDFGIAKVIDALDRAERTATGMVFGTPWYMSPEQALGDSAIDGRTDVWSVGAMIYEMLCGTLPFGGNNPNAVMAQIIFGRPTPLQHYWVDAPEDILAVVHKALERDLDKRFDSMVSFRDALAACSLWKGVTPEISQGFLPRPSSFEGINDLLPEDFKDDPHALQAPSPSAEPRQRMTSEPFDPRPEVFTAPPQAIDAAPVVESIVPLVAPAPREPRVSMEEERIQTRPIPPRAEAEPTLLSTMSEAEIGTELLLSPPRRDPAIAGLFQPAQVSQRRPRLESDTLPPEQGWSARWPRLVSFLSLLFMLFCGAALAVGVMSWMQRPRAGAITPAPTPPSSR